jgi:hypothetical protein
MFIGKTSIPLSVLIDRLISLSGLKAQPLIWKREGESRSLVMALKVAKDSRDPSLGDDFAVKSSNVTR